MPITVGDSSKPEYFGKEVQNGFRESFGRDLSDMFNYSDAVRKALNDIVKILPQPFSVATTKWLSGIRSYLIVAINDLYETFSLTLVHIYSSQKGPDPMDKRSPWVGTVRTFE